MNLTDWIVVAVIGAAAHAFCFTYFDNQYQSDYDRCVGKIVGLHEVIPSKPLMMEIYARCAG